MARERRRKNEVSAAAGCGEIKMFLHAGSNTVIKKEEIIGIFDIDSQNTPETTKKFLRRAEKDGVSEMAGYDLPKAFILTSDKNKKRRVIFSHLSAKTLAQRAEIPLT
ncbi:MAG: DUF370 domain-containing protein [Clostridia bacterium]|nr:DUF370 domain-containing protein [Clostridia bacterium]